MTNNHVTLRPMVDKDAESFLRTLRDSIRGVASVDYPPEVIDGWAPELSEANIWQVKQNPENEVRIVAEIEGEVVGIGSTIPESNELRACYVSPRGLRKGIGSSIVRELENIARKSGVDRFTLHGTITAEPFYLSLGYQVDERITHRTSSGVEMEAVIMSKRL